MSDLAKELATNENLYNIPEGMVGEIINGSVRCSWRHERSAGTLIGISLKAHILTNQCGERETSKEFKQLPFGSTLFCNSGFSSNRSRIELRHWKINLPPEPWSLSMTADPARRKATYEDSCSKRRCEIQCASVLGWSCWMALRSN